MYKIDEQIFEKNFIQTSAKDQTKKFTHASNDKFKDLPFFANTSKEKEIVKDFSGVMGEYVRLLLKKKLSENVDLKTLIDNIMEKISCEDEERYKLERIIRKLYFDENEELYLFSNQAMLYINGNSNDKKIARFIYDVLNGEVGSELMRESFGQTANNVMDALVLSALPELKDVKEERNTYLKMVPYVGRKFIEDFKYITSEEGLVRKYLKSLLAYYYFFYISQVSLKQNRFFEADHEKIEELFFSVEWEKLTKTRQAYNYGWRKLERNINNLFSHSKLLEILNQNEGNEPYTYMDIRDNVEHIKQTTFGEEIKKVIECYTTILTDFDFSEVQYNDEAEEKVFNDIKYLFECIDAQFRGTVRFRAYTAYNNWFIQFCKSNTLKNRRSMGYTLNLKEEDIIFLTKVCIKNQEKMKLKDLFKAFEERGVFLDLKSKEEIHGYFEKLNLIEKKSDSGDAQYVKGIL